MNDEIMNYFNSLDNYVNLEGLFLFNNMNNLVSKDYIINK